MTFLRALSPRVLFGLAVLVLVLGACGGGSTYSYDEGELAQRFLPTERTVKHHPDSLRALSISKEEGTYQFDLERDFASLHRKWSCTYQSMGAGRSRSGRSYATFWSLELSLASLQPEVGLTSLSEEQAKKSLRKRRQEYRTSIQIDVFWFEEEGNSLLAGPGTQVELQINGNRYQPSRESHGPLREAFIPERAGGALYRRNTFYFPRIVDSTDVLKDAQGMELYISRTGAGARVRFAWSWEEEGQESARSRVGEQARSWAFAGAGVKPRLRQGVHGGASRPESHTHQANGEDTAKWAPPRTFTFVSGPRLRGFVGADEVGTSFAPNTVGTDEAKKPGTGSEVPGGVWANIGPVLNFHDANVPGIGNIDPFPTTSPLMHSLTHTSVPLFVHAD